MFNFGKDLRINEIYFGNLYTFMDGKRYDDEFFSLMIKEQIGNCPVPVFRVVRRYPDENNVGCIVPDALVIDRSITTEARNGEFYVTNVHSILEFTGDIGKSTISENRAKALQNKINKEDSVRREQYGNAKSAKCFTR